MRKNILAAVFIAAAALAFAQVPNDFKIDLSQKLDTITITGYTGNKTRVVIPAEIEGIPVRAIGGNAFWRDKNITEVVIPGTVTVIEDGIAGSGGGAFRECSRLISVTLPAALTKIGDGAFAGCSRLSSITIPGGVTTIGEAAFADCDGFTSIVIPEGVKTIGPGAFRDCSNLTKVTVTPGMKIRFIENYGYAAFHGCGRLDVKSQIALKRAGYNGGF
jgi:hypothetical protein